MNKSEPEKNSNQKEKSPSEIFPKESCVSSDNTSTEKKVCDLGYLTEMMGGKKHLIKEIIELFIKQVPDELQSMNEAIGKADYVAIKSIAHKMKSSLAIMGISVLVPVLQGMEELGGATTDPDNRRIEKINELNQKLTILYKQVIAEIETEKHHYI